MFIADFNTSLISNVSRSQEVEIASLDAYERCNSLHFNYNSLITTASQLGMHIAGGLSDILSSHGLLNFTQVRAFVPLTCMFLQT